MSELFDTHCHIQSAGLSDGERQTNAVWAKDSNLTGNSLVERANEAGVTRLLCVGCDLNDSLLAVRFVQQRPQCWATIGIHPHEAQHYAGNNEKLTTFAQLATADKVIAVGECGLDYFYEHSPRGAQVEILKFQIELALKHTLPMVFHVRGALNDFWPIFDSYKGIRGVLHSFTDSQENLTRAIERGLYIGVNGIATFAKNTAQLDVYKAIPLDRLVLETDAPFLTPTPYRGSINEPRQITTIADFVSDLRGESREQMSDAATSNARTLFGV